jgi:hypothetical protein
VAVDHQCAASEIQGFINALLEQKVVRSVVGCQKFLALSFAQNSPQLIAIMRVGVEHPHASLHHRFMGVVFESLHVDQQS